MLISILSHNCYFAHSTFISITGSCDDIIDTGNYFFTVSISSIPDKGTTIASSFFYKISRSCGYLDVSIQCKSYNGDITCEIRFYRIWISIYGTVVHRCCSICCITHIGTQSVLCSYVDFTGGGINTNTIDDFGYKSTVFFCEVMYLCHVVLTDEVNTLTICTKPFSSGSVYNDASDIRTVQ